MKFLPKNIDYLSSGSVRQKQAYVAINDLGIFNKLEKFNPILAGTIPLDIDTSSSDLDIICESSDLSEFESILKMHYGSFKEFKSHIINIRGIPSSVTSFEANDFTFEVFCQNVPVEKQFAVVHLKVEAKLLELSGAHARNSIRLLKQQGIKTEPAFTKYFKIAGDPYDELAKLADYSDQQLQKIIDELARTTT